MLIENFLEVFIMCSDSHGQTAGTGLPQPLPATQHKLCPRCKQVELVDIRFKLIMACHWDPNQDDFVWWCSQCGYYQWTKPRPIGPA
ncbi:MAG: hypothetical protein A2744_03860 [Candidatus Buchananbacteria bacterium RIFCSPHIGHO2_01_FULL_44_11]|nr:MAG: hypothetical protein A2744_03860 [Candidatus Buchananbacteria bacterium RIFCSPHIGHO2_01_FULL_44_11]